MAIKAFLVLVALFAISQVIARPAETTEEQTKTVEDFLKQLEKNMNEFVDKMKDEKLVQDFSKQLEQLTNDLNAQVKSAQEKITNAGKN